MVEIAKAKVKKANLFVGDAQDIDLKENTFDFVVCMDILEHVDDPLKVMNETIRVLKREGIAVITTPNPLWAPIMWIAEKLKMKVEEGPHKFIFLPGYIKKLKNINILYSGYIAYTPFKTNQKIEEFFSQFPLTKYLGFNFMLIIQKL